jgi:ubiquinone/menaquinone biosynthesis C-methylase UbiE
MEYLSANDIKNNKKEYVFGILKDHVGRNLENLFAAKLTANYHDLLFSSDRHHSKILDCGIGNGEFARQLNDIGFDNVCGTDIDNYLSEKNTSFVKEFKIDDFNCERMPWPDNYFEIATAWCVLPHLENPHFFIREILRVLKPNGLLILSIPHILSKASLNYFRKNGDFPRYLSSTNHITVFTPGSFKNLMRNFNVVNMEYMIDNRIFNGVKGKLRKILFVVFCSNSVTKQYINKLWGYNQIWILSKKIEHNVA